MEWISFKDQEPPKDGSHILCYDPTHDEAKIYVVKYIPGYKPFYSQEMFNGKWEEAAGEGYFEWNPTHWMPLPEEPSEPKKQKNIGACNLVSSKVSPEYAQILCNAYETFRDAIDDQAKNWMGKK